MPALLRKNPQSPLLLLSILSILAALFGATPSRGQTGGVEPAEKPAAKPLEIVAAYRYAASVRRVDENGERVIEKNVLRGHANPAILRQLNLVVAHGSRVDTRSYSLDGLIYSYVCGCHPQDWIDCRFQDGQELRIYIHHRKWRVSGESGFDLAISKSEAFSLLDASGWIKLDSATAIDLPDPQGTSPFSAALAKQRIAFKSILERDPEAEPAMIVSAECHAFYPKGFEASKTPTEESRRLGKANAATLERLQNVIHRNRVSTAQYFPNGEVHRAHVEEQALAWIHCKLDDGQYVLVHAFPSDGAWVVIGEDGYRLEISRTESREMLNDHGWE